jgi:predicted metal-dependent hydrolase
MKGCRVKRNRPANAKKKQKLEKYVPPTLVDYGNVTKITATSKTISGPDMSAKKGVCL